MKIHRFIGDFDLSDKEVYILNKENIKQIRDVLRLTAGEKVILSDGAGISAEVTLTNVSSDEVKGTIEKIVESPKDEKVVKLYLAILKKENFELAVQKAVEIGVSGIVPVITERTIKTGLNFERLNKIVIEASEQSGRSILPTVYDILDFKDALIDGGVADEKTLFDLNSQPHTPHKDAKSVSLFVGPEGGFTEAEVSMARDYGYDIASLGALTLRGETAAIVAAYKAVAGI